MHTTGQTILITGGATGIGFALAQALVEKDNHVLICGRREHKLREAKAKLPQVDTRVCDVSNPQNRHDLFQWAITHFGGLNVLINNAGIQRKIDLRRGVVNVLNREDEIATNFEAPLHLSALFIPHLLDQHEAAIVNVTSGLAFAPLSMVPVYCATKAALHSLTLSLRHQLSGTSIKVFEVAPPLVDTELNDGARDERRLRNKGIAPEEVAKATMQGLEDDQFEIVIGMARDLRLHPEKMFHVLNG